MTDRHVFRSSLPVDGRWHDLDVGQLLHVAARQLDVVELWWLTPRGPHRRRFRVFGTGEAIPPRSRYCGTALTPSTPQTAVDSFVWHVFEVPA